MTSLPSPKNWREYATPLPYGNGSSDEDWDGLLAYPGHEEGHWAYIECAYCAWDDAEDYDHPCPGCNDSGVVLRPEVALLLGERGLRVQLEAWRMAEARERLLLEIERIKKRKVEKGARIMLDKYRPGEQRIRDEAEEATLHSFDMRPPTIVLGQTQSQDRTAGMLQRTDTQEEFTTLEVVPLVVRRSRLKWPEGKFSRDMLPECWSDDGIVGSARPIMGVNPLFPAKECSGCEFYTAEPWAVGKDQGWCMPGYNVLLMDAGTYEVYLMRLRGTAAKIAKTLGAKGIYHKAVVSLSAELVQAPTGTWYQLKAKPLRRLGEADLSLIVSMYRDFAGAAVEGEDNSGPPDSSPYLEPPLGTDSVPGEGPTDADLTGLPLDQRPKPWSSQGADILDGLPF